MTAESFHSHLRSRSTRVPHTPVSGMEWNGMEGEWNGFVNSHPYLPVGTAGPWMAADAADIGGGSQ